MMKKNEKNKHLIQLGQQIRKRRKNLGFTQEGLAFESDLDRSYIGGVERGERNISFLMLIKIAKALSCDIAELTRNNPNE